MPERRFNDDRVTWLVLKRLCLKYFIIELIWHKTKSPFQQMVLFGLQHPCKYTQIKWVWMVCLSSLCKSRNGLNEQKKCLKKCLNEKIHGFHTYCIKDKAVQKSVSLLLSSLSYKAWNNFIQLFRWYPMYAVAQKPSWTSTHHLHSIQDAVCWTVSETARLTQGVCQTIQYNTFETLVTIDSTNRVFYSKSQVHICSDIVIYQWNWNHTTPTQARPLY